VTSPLREPEQAPDRPPSPLRDTGVNALWHRLSPRAWTSLALVTVEEDDQSRWLAKRLAAIAEQARQPLTALVVSAGSPGRAVAVAHALSALRSRPRPRSRRYLVATGAPLAHPELLELTAAADAVLVLLRRGQTSLPEARRLVRLLGRERVIGCVLVAW